ncbi:MAG TPA: phosphatase PAP2 family protein [Thermoanaerobaculaceae bacterium]|nr:phosphatase PAP2 family protein [Thermoanaerobaculaceae bacterium]
MATPRRSMDGILEPPSPARKGALRPAETLLLLALAAMTAVAWAHPAQVPLAARASFMTVGALFAIAALALGENRSGWRYWCRELLPVPVVPYIFLNLGRLIPLVNPRTYDEELEALDRALLGHEAQAALYSLPLPGWIADVLTVAYSTFFFLAIALAVVLAARHDPFLPQVTAAVVFTFVVSYAGYFVVPAYGPRTTVAQQRYLSLPPGLVGEKVRDRLDHWEKTKTDAFPSGHTMVTLAVLYCARRRYRTLYNVLLPIGTLLIAATILLTYHYVVDILAAIPLMVGSVALAAWIAGPVPRSEPPPKPA